MAVFLCKPAVTARESEELEVCVVCSAATGANLRGCDLRGAKIDGVDFYVVDLREAKYTPYQRAIFENCDAILETRV